jgi:hypothetical protein
MIIDLLLSYYLSSNLIYGMPTSWHLCAVLMESLNQFLLKLISSIVETYILVLHLLFSSNTIILYQITKIESFFYQLFSMLQRTSDSYAKQITRH